LADREHRYPRWPDEEAASEDASDDDVGDDDQGDGGATALRPAP
jgi:hypothetical protein